MIQLFTFSLPGATFVIADENLAEARSAAREYIRKFLDGMDPGEADRCEPSIVPAPGWVCILHPGESLAESARQSVGPPSRG